MALVNIVDRHHLWQPAFIKEGALLLIDKPTGWTSFDVVNKLRWQLKQIHGQKKYKVGHAGTLDPLATGLLLVCIGPYTKQIDLLQGMDKTYSGTIKIGAETPSYDSETLANCYYPHRPWDQEYLNTKAQSFVGEIDQYPPPYSAIKQNGVALYKLARRGQDIELKSRRLTVHKYDILKVNGDEVSFFVSCSKGTYIRSLAHDLGHKVDSGAYLTSLKRESIGDYKLSNAYSVTEMVELIQLLKAVV